MLRLHKEKFNKSTPIKKCDICGEVKKVYLETKIKNTQTNDSVFCSKKCVTKGFGKSREKKQ